MGQGSFKQEKGSKTWSAQFSYKDYYGNTRRKHKRGFATKREAIQFRNEFVLKQQSNIDMSFASFIEEYKENMYSDLRDSTIATKTHMIELHILPYFKNMKVSEITALDITRWHTEIKKKGYSEAYLWSINTQLNAIFNHAVKFYKLSYNPCKGAGFMGKSKSGNMGIWSENEFEQFLEVVKDKPVIYNAFFLMYWTGLRVGELLALDIKDIDLETGVLSVTKSLNRVKGEDIISPPKTQRSIRKIPLPKFCVDKMNEYINTLYGRTPNDRLFIVTKSHLEKEIKRGADLAGLKQIRVHDLRHSHASLLISKGVDIATISNRLGHEKISTTLNTYSHMFETSAAGVADMLDNLYSGEED